MLNCIPSALKNNCISKFVSKPRVQTGLIVLVKIIATGGCALRSEKTKEQFDFAFKNTKVKTVNPKTVHKAKAKKTSSPNQPSIPKPSAWVKSAPKAQDVEAGIVKQSKISDACNKADLDNDEFFSWEEEPLDELSDTDELTDAADIEQPAPLKNDEVNNSEAQQEDLFNNSHVTLETSDVDSDLNKEDDDIEAQARSKTALEQTIIEINDAAHEIFVGNDPLKDEETNLFATLWKTAGYYFGFSNETQTSSEDSIPV